jgi:pilus assembly protein CpaC
LWRDAARGYTGSLAGPASAGQFLNIPGTSSTSGPPPIGAPAAGDAFNILFSTGLSSFPFSTVLSILSQEGLAKVLAEPTLVALSGHEAAFHAGGEIPILYAQQLGAVSIQFKKFGVQLKFMPTVLGEKTISLKVFAEVSEPDYANAVTLSGYQVPGFKTRNSETTVRLRDGQSFAIAGLLTDKIRTTINKIPLLGEIPVLGALFRSTSFQRDESELLVVVRAHMTQPLPEDQVPLMPGEDQLNDPSDFQLFMLGSLGPWKRDQKQKEQREEQSPETEPTPEPEKQAAAGGPLGPIGFIRE